MPRAARSGSFAAQVLAHQDRHGRGQAEHRHEGQRTDVEGEIRRRQFFDAEAAHQEYEHGEPGHLQQHLQAGRPAELEQPLQQRPVEFPVQRAEHATIARQGQQHRIDHDFGRDRDKRRPGTAGNARRGKPGMPENPRVVQDDVQQHRSHVDQHDDPGLALAGVRRTKTHSRPAWRECRGRGSGNTPPPAPAPARCARPGQRSHRRTASASMATGDASTAIQTPCQTTAPNPPGLAGPEVLGHERPGVQTQTQWAANQRPPQ